MFTRHVRRRLGSVATRAEAVVTRYGILADGVLAARTGRQDGAFVNVFEKNEEKQDKNNN